MDGTGQKELSDKQIRKLPVSLPSLEKQVEVVQILTAANEEIFLIDTKIEALIRQKRGLMQKLLTGEWRAKVDHSGTTTQAKEAPMADDKNYWTQQRPDGKWESKREGGERASKVTENQAEAWDYSKSKAKESGGEAFLKGRDGKIRERNTYGKDPYPPKG